MTPIDAHADTDGEVADKLQSFLDVLRENDPIGWPRALKPSIERAIHVLRNPRFSKFICECQKSPTREHNGRGGDDAGQSAYQRTTPVTQPAPQRLAQGECRHSLWSPAGGYCLDCGYSPVGPDEESAIDAAVGLTKVVLRLPVDLLGEIDHRAQQSGCVRNAYLRQLLAEHHSQPPRQDRGEELHTAICQAVALMNMEPMTSSGLLQAHDILRKAIS